MGERMVDKINSKRYPVKARSHLLHLLGDELIGDDRLAVFELVKNGYDADATTVNVTLDVDSDEDDGCIVVEDNGHGMTLDDIKNKWLEIGTDSKRKKKIRSPKFLRLPLGEKGVGRLAAFKLGEEISLITRYKNNPEVIFKVHWNELIESSEYINDLGVEVAQNTEPKFFMGDSSGTRVEIRKLRRSEWSRGDIRSLYRLVTSLSSPFDTPESFSVNFDAVGRESEYMDMLKPEDFLEQAIWKYDFKIEGNKFSWKYRFRPPHWKNLTKNSLSGEGDSLQLIPDAADRRKRKEKKSLLLRDEHLNGIGPISGVIYAFYRRTEVLKVSGNQSQLKSWLDDQCGVRVYRDGVRVFNYGEPNDDWLGLNVKRINEPTGRLGTKSVVSAISLNLKHSSKLKEKTNREGFETNKEYEVFKRVIESVFEHFGQLHGDDRKKIDSVIKGRDPDEKKPKINEAINELKNLLVNHPEYNVIKRDLDSIEDEFKQVRDVMVGAGMAGLNLAVVFHEVERGVEALDDSAKRGDDIKALRKHIMHVQSLLKIFSPLLKKNPARSIFVSELVEAAIEMRTHRFKVHDVIMSAPILTGEEPDFKVKVPANLIVGVLGNLIDNSIYWTQYRRERDESGSQAAIRIITHWDVKQETGFIGVIDNGPGFSIDSNKAVEPFYTKRPEGMGLGLYFSDLVMEQCGGVLSIEDIDEARDEVDIPDAYDGAAVLLRFGGGR